MGKIFVHSERGYRTDIHIRQHTIIADEPIQAGGTDSGPTPMEMLLGTAGACIAVTTRAYAQRKGWPLEEVEVRLSHRRDYTRDCEDCDTQPVQVDWIDRRITLKGQLDQAQRARLLQIAEKCPVHRTLTGTIQVSDSLE